MTILIVDDLPANVRLLRAQLEGAGQTVLSAQNGEEALTFLREHEVHAVVSDILMPVLDGFQLTLRIRSEPAWDRIPVVMLTATYSSPDDRSFGEDVGVDGFFVKPVDIGVLLGHIAELRAHPPRRKHRRVTPKREAVARELTDRLIKKLEEKNEELARQAERLQTEADNRRLAEDSHRLFSTAAQVSEDSIIITNRDGIITYVNPAFERTTGYSAREAIGKTPRILKSGAQDGTYYKHLWDTLLSGKSFRGTVINRRKDGTLYHEDHTIVPIIDDQGQISRFISTGRDLTERVVAEKAVKASADELRALFAAMDDIVLVVDTDGRVVEVAPTNPSFLHYRPPDEFLGRSVDEMFPDERASEFLQAIREAIAKKRTVRLEYDMRIDTEDVWFDATVSPFRDDAAIWIARDVTVRKLAQTELQQAHRTLKNLFNNLDVMVFSQNMKDGQVLDVSPACMSIYGRPPEEFLADPRLWMTVIHPEDMHRVTTVQAQVSEGSNASWECRIVRPDGTIRWIETKLAPVLDDDGHVVRVDGVTTDITARKLAEARLAQSERKYRTLFEESKDGLFFTHVDGAILDVNAAVVRLFGYESKEEALQLNIGTDLYVRPEDRTTLLQELRLRGSVDDFEVALRRKDGSTMLALLSAAAVLDEKGKLSNIRGMIRDITNQRHLEQQLLQAQKLESVGTLAGGIAHDFNNVLGIIMAHATIMPAELRTPDNIRQSFEGIYKAAERGAALVRQLLTFARKAETEVQPIRLNEIVREAVAMLRETFPKTLILTADLDPTLPFITADANQMHQVILNLCVNARDAMPSGGEMTLTTSVAHWESLVSTVPTVMRCDHVCLVVADTGTGMDEETQQRIFEPFFTTKEKGKGTGLGLSTVFGIVSNHGGHIEVRSEPGRGTSFLLYFPAYQAVSAHMADSPAASMEHLRGSGTVLLIEDEDSLRGSMSRFLERLGYTVVAASDGVEGVTKFSRSGDAVNVVITDLGLPRLGGEDVITSIRAMRGDIPVIVMSGYLEPSVKSRIDEGGAVTFIPKPFAPHTLAIALARKLNQQKPRA